MGGKWRDDEWFGILLTVQAQYNGFGILGIFRMSSHNLEKRMPRSFDIQNLECESSEYFQISIYKINGSVITV